MLFYVAVFCITGLIIGFVIKSEIISATIICLISLLWAFVAGIWALATFVELLVGYGVARVIKDSFKRT